MESNLEHQKKANTTDQKFRTDDEHLREIDKRHLKENEKDSASLIPKPAKKSDGEKE